MSDTLAPPANTAIRHRRFDPGHLWVHVLLAVGAVVMVFPFIWQFLTSFKTTAESLAVPPTILPSQWQFQNYVDATTLIPFAEQFGVSVISVLSRTIVVLILCSAAGYAFARMRFPGKNIIFVALLGIMMVPRELYLLPQTEIMQRLGLLDSIPGLRAPRLHQRVRSVPHEAVLPVAPQLSGGGGTSRRCRTGAHLSPDHVAAG